LVLPGFKAVLYTTQVLSPFTIMVRLGLKYCGTGVREPQSNAPSGVW